MSNISKLIIDNLAAIGIDTYFLVTGGAISPFVDCLQKSSYYCFQHEQAAAMAADGYYRSSGKIAVVLATSGPGAQNLINGICGCWFDSIPCLFITGQVNTRESLDSINSRPRQVGFQEMPFVSMISECTKFSHKITNIHEISDVFSRAIESITNNRLGPAVIDFPVNFQMDEAPDQFCFKIKKYDFPKISINDKILEAVHNAKRPVVIIGNGARGMSDLHTWLNVPFVSSWAAVDLITHDHPLYAGSYGVYGNRVANYVVQNADLLVILGSRMDTRQTGGNLNLFSRESKRIMVDIDSEEITKLPERGFNIDFPLVGTVLSFTSQISLQSPVEWINTVNVWKNDFSRETTREGNVYTFLENIKFPEECIIIPDTGGNLVWTIQTMHLNGKQRLFTNLGNSSMGWSLPAAIGAAIATRGKVPIV
jgi:acetolactate synthase-1/2/3 large subunit